MNKAQREFDVVIVGAGFAGLYMLYRARELGLSTVVLEAGGGVGGTWYWNRYPGARCDVESMQYSYQFSDDLEQEWEWTERYAGQPEILRYLEHVADRFDLWPHIQLDTQVTEAMFEDGSGRWSVRTGQRDEFGAQFVIMATGCLSATNVPDFAGAETFRGRTYHTGRWPHEGVDFTGMRVGVIGTGSSGVQSIPVIAQQARDLVVFQRTATYSVPAHNGPLDQSEQTEIKAHYGAFRTANSRMLTAIGERRARTDLSALVVPNSSVSRSGPSSAIRAQRNAFVRTRSSGASACVWTQITTTRSISPMYTLSTCGSRRSRRSPTAVSGPRAGTTNWTPLCTRPDSMP